MATTTTNKACRRWLASVTLVVVLAALARSSSADGASTAPLGRMSLEEARTFARSHHLGIVAARRRLEAARREADVPGAQWLPRVGVMAQLVGSTTNNSTATVLGTSAVDLPRIGATKIEASADGQPYPSTAVALGVRQQVLDFGRVAAERSAALLASEVERFRVGGTALDVDFGVEQAYFATLASVAIEDASRAAFERAVQHRDLARANVASGLRAPIELTRAEADVARYEAGTMRAAASVHASRAAFANAVGVDEIELDAAGSLITSSPLPPLETALGMAVASPSVLESRARVAAQRAETTRLDAQTRPTVGVSASVSGRAGGAPPSSGPGPTGDGWLPTVPNYGVGVVLAWPIFEPTWGRRAEVSRARAQALAAEADLAVRTQRARIAAAYQEAAASLETLGALRRGADAAKANYDQAENRFRVGLGTSTELADAQALRTDSDIQLTVGFFQVARARAALTRAIAEAK